MRDPSRVAVRRTRRAAAGLPCRGCGFKPAWPILLLAGCLAATSALAQQAGDPARLDQAFRTLAAFKEGAPADDIQYLAGEVVSAARDPAQRKAMQARLVAFLGGEATDTGKDIALRHLVLVGDDGCVPVAAAFLADERLSPVARSVLERLPGAASATALREALARASGKTRLGLVHSLGRRGDAASVGALAKLTADADTELATAAVAALGKIDAPRAVDAVRRARADARLKAEASDALLALAARSRARGDTETALAVYRDLWASGEPAMNRVAALQGFAALGDSASLQTMIGALADPESSVRDSVIPCLREAAGDGVTASIATQLGVQPADVQARLLLVLRDRGGAAARPAALDALKSGDEAVRIAALEAMAVLGDAAAVGAVAARASSGSDAEKTAARTALARMPGRGVDEAMAFALGRGPSDVKVELARALGARGSETAVTALLQAARGDDDAVRGEALKQLRKVAGPARIPDLVKVLLSVPEGAREDAARAIVSVCLTVPERGRRGDAILAALGETREPALRIAMIRILGEIGDPRGVTPAVEAAEGNDAPLRDAAIRALAGWPDASPFDALERFAKQAADPTLRSLALRGYVRMIGMLSDRRERDLVALYEKAMGMATQPAEKTEVLARLGELRDAGALRIARQCAQDPALKDAAELAAARIEKNRNAPAGATASHHADRAGLAMDGKPETRWDTGAQQQGGEWFLLDLGMEKLVRKVVLDTQGSGNDFPNKYEVHVGITPEPAGEPAARGEGQSAVTEIVFNPPRVGRFIRIVQTGQKSGLFWSIHELTVDAAAAPE